MSAQYPKILKYVFCHSGPTVLRIKTYKSLVIICLSCNFIVHAKLTYKVLKCILILTILKPKMTAYWSQNWLSLYDSFNKKTFNSSRTRDIYLIVVFSILRHKWELWFHFQLVGLDGTQQAWYTPTTVNTWRPVAWGSGATGEAAAEKGCCDDLGKWEVMISSDSESCGKCFDIRAAGWPVNKGTLFETQYSDHECPLRKLLWYNYFSLEHNIWFRFLWISP